MRPAGAPCEDICWFREEVRRGGRLREGPMHYPIKAQIHSDSGRSSKIITDREGIEAVVDVPGVGSLVLHVERRGWYSLWGRPEGDEAGEATRRELLVTGVIRADGILVDHPESGSTPRS